MTTTLLAALAALVPLACGGGPAGDVADAAPAAARDAAPAATQDAAPGRAPDRAQEPPPQDDDPSRDAAARDGGPAPDAGIHAAFDALLARHVHGDVVDYAGLGADRAALQDYLATLARTDPDALDRAGRMALWINAYNAFTLELVLRELPGLESIKDIPSGRRWEGRLWDVGGTRYSLDQIEHEILRPMGDARVHFAINCASQSCPALADEAYLPQTLDSQLDAAGRAFLADPERGLRFGDERGLFGTSHVLRLSRIFDWFEDDFERDGTRLDFVLRFAPERAVAYVREHRDDLDVEFLDYDWSLNDR